MPAPLGGGGGKIRWPTTSSSNQAQAQGRFKRKTCCLRLTICLSGQAGDYKTDLDSPTLPPRPTAGASTSKLSTAGDGGHSSSPPGRSPPLPPTGQFSTSLPYNAQSYDQTSSTQAQTSPKRWNLKSTQQAGQQDTSRWGVKFNHSNTANQNSPPKPPLPVCTRPQFNSERLAW